jgi:hypothetical protein
MTASARRPVATEGADISRSLTLSSSLWRSGKGDQDGGRGRADPIDECCPNVTPGLTPPGFPPYHLLTSNYRNTGVTPVLPAVLSRVTLDHESECRHSSLGVSIALGATVKTRVKNV